MNIVTPEKANQIVKDLKIPCRVANNGDVQIKSAYYELAIRAWIKAVGECFYCHKELSPSLTTIDHMIPNAQNGNLNTQNVVASCQSCNSKKGFMTVAQFEAYKDFLDRGKNADAWEYKHNVELDMQKHRMHGQYVTGDWKIEYMPLSWIKIGKERWVMTFEQENVDQERARKNRETKYFELYGFLRKPLLLSSNLVLVEGMRFVKVAVEKGIDSVPVEVMRDVECTDTVCYSV